ncbi:MAG: HAD family acid phosphatase, partial [Bacteroidales bacterium]
YGVNIFYITNRKEKYREATLKNLRDHNLPQAETEHLFMRTSTSSKKERREKVQEDYHIALLIGDNLNDFSEIFEHKSNHRRKKLVDRHREEFGRRFILLPNATYGDWEAAVYDYDFSLDEKAKHKERLNSLKAF